MSGFADSEEYCPGMERIESDILDKVLDASTAYEPSDYDEKDVFRALIKERIQKEDFAALLSPAAKPFLEEIAQRAHRDTMRYFGNSVSIFTPLYASNYCSNECIYCGFNRTNSIKRAKLTEAEAVKEMDAIASAGIREVLLLTGESEEHSDTGYLAGLVSMAAEKFSNVGMEVYPLNVDGYSEMHRLGADYVTVFQETYDPKRYSEVHRNGRKKVFSYRFDSHERALLGGMRGVAFAPLLGLSDFRKDSFACGVHATEIQRRYPHAEMSFSLPRLRPFAGSAFAGGEVSESDLLQVALAYRIFMPFAGQTISSRERPAFRDNLVKICATKMSAGVSVRVGGHVSDGSDGQFDICDPRPVEEIRDALVRNGRQPVFNDYVRV